MLSSLRRVTFAVDTPALAVLTVHRCTVCDSRSLFPNTASASVAAQ